MSHRKSWADDDEEEDGKNKDAKIRDEGKS